MCAFFAPPPFFFSMSKKMLERDFVLSLNEVIESGSNVEYLKWAWECVCIPFLNSLLWHNEYEKSTKSILCVLLQPLHNTLPWGVVKTYLFQVTSFCIKCSFYLNGSMAYLIIRKPKCVKKTNLWTHSLHSNGWLMCRLYYIHVVGKRMQMNAAVKSSLLWR